MAETNNKAILRKDARKTTSTDAAPKTKAAPKTTGWVQIRLFPIWLRIIIVLALIVIAAALGAMIGYGVIGDGKAADALKWETWQHILDIMSGKK
ncbi:DNA-directed RNA polymerase subunit beta [Planococcus chinensis]|uniref:DNA-directed RNA polymerase subunit beta n=1 Tax=Planococcus chinensis TaxID=272917 RepID=A0ABW4QE77_9BACL